MCAIDYLLLGHFPPYRVLYFPEGDEAVGYYRRTKALVVCDAEFVQATQGITCQLALRAQTLRCETSELLPLL